SDVCSSDLHHQQHHDNHVGDAVDNLHNTHHDIVGQAPKVAGDAAVNHAHHQVDGHGGEGDHQGDTAALKGAHQQVAAQAVGAEDVHQVLPLVALVDAGEEEALVAAGKVLLPAVERRDPGDDHTRENQQNDDAQTYHGHTVFLQPANGVLPIGHAGAGHALPFFRVGAHP